ncbi:type I restriction-modification system endonuclease [bacterium]|nr:type I restriction-modification system endonuclease [bacterium]
MSGSVQSVNFGFLSQHGSLLVQVAAQAERYVFTDPDVCLLKVRQLSELLAQQCAARIGMQVAAEDSQLRLIQRLYESRLFDSQIAQLFHSIRKAGNIAAHQPGQSTRSDALQSLRLSRELAVWFNRSFGAGDKTTPGRFIPPPNPEAAEQELRDELDRLRDELLTATERASAAEVNAEQQSAARQQAESDAQRLYEEVEAAVSLAAETEERAQAERVEFEAMLDELTANAQSDEARTAEVVAVAQREAEQLQLDEQATRHLIDEQLREAGWEADSAALKHSRGTRPVKGRNLAIAEWPTESGPADYVLFVGLTPVAVVEAKSYSTDIPDALEQAKRYSRTFQEETGQASPGGPWDGYRIPFVFATNGRPFLKQIREKSGVWFLDARLARNRPRSLPGWYSPEGLSGLLQQDIPAAEQRLQTESASYLPLRPYQFAAVRAVEQAVISGQRRMLVAMATGTGKTRTCIGIVYRLIKAGRFRRVLFLVDRTALGEQTADAFGELKLESFQSFTEIYNVRGLGDATTGSEAVLHIATIQAMVKRVLDSEEAPPSVDEYDCVVVDECHRGYGLDAEMSDLELTFRSEAEFISRYTRVLDWFDAVRIGLTATPALHTTELFAGSDRLPVFEYSYRQAVIDGHLVDHEPPFRLVTELSEDGMHWERGQEMAVVNRRTGQHERFETPDEVDLEIDAFNRKVRTESFNRVVCRELAEQIDPRRNGKTMVFCVDEAHAVLVTDLLSAAMQDRYGELPASTVRKITGQSDRPLELIRYYKNERTPNIAVTVDLLTTGIDVPAIENIVFLRRVRSRILYEQMLGRATRLCDDLHGPGQHKQAFRIFDAVDLYSALESHSDMKPVVQRPSIPLGRLIEELNTVDDDEPLQQIKDELTVRMAKRLQRLDEERTQHFETMTGLTRQQMMTQLRTSSPQEVREQLQQWPDLAPFLEKIVSQGRQLILSDHEDSLRRVERGYGSGVRPDDYLESFRRFITENADAIPALIVVTQRPRELTRAQLRELRLLLDQEGFTETALRTAWQQTTNQDIAASIVGYIRYVALDQPLISHSERVQAAMQEIIGSRSWTAPQRQWLERIGKQLEQEVIVDREALDSGQFKAQGGFERLNKVFKGELESILNSITDGIWQAV